MKSKKKYVEPQYRIIELDELDVIRTSDPDEGEWINSENNQN